MLFFRSNSKICILQLILEILASSRLVRTSRKDTGFPVPYHLSTVHLVLTAKWLALRVLASKPHVEDAGVRCANRVSFGAMASVRPGLRVHPHTSGAPRRLRLGPA